MSDEQKQMKLIASDGSVFEVDQDVGFKSKTIKEMCSNLGLETPEIPLTEVDSVTLKKIVDYCVLYRNEEYIPKGEKEDQRIELTDKHREYLDVEDEFLMKMLTAANYLEIGGLVDIITQKVANMISNKCIDEIREIYQLPDDFTKEQKMDLAKKYDFLNL